MKFSDFLESRFVSSQIDLNERGKAQSQTPQGVAENQALKVIMWAHLSCLTVFYFFAVLGRFFAVKARLAQPPRLAREIAQSFFERGQAIQKANQRLASEVMVGIAKEPEKQLEPGVH